MATVINQPAESTGSSGMGFLLGIILVLAVVVLLALYALPALRTGFGGGAQVNVPSSIDVHTSK